MGEWEVGWGVGEGANESVPPARAVAVVVRPTPLTHRGEHPRQQDAVQGHVVLRCSGVGAGVDARCPHRRSERPPLSHIPLLHHACCAPPPPTPSTRHDEHGHGGQLGGEAGVHTAAARGASEGRRMPRGRLAGALGWAGARLRGVLDGGGEGVHAPNPANTRGGRGGARRSLRASDCAKARSILQIRACRITEGGVGLGAAHPLALCVTKS